MFPWLIIALNALWILGAGILLTVLSYASWLAREQNQSLRRYLNNPNSKSWLWLGLTLIAASLALTSAALWERITWTLFTVFALINLWRVDR